MYKNLFAVLLTFTVLFLISGCKDESTTTTPSGPGTTTNHPPDSARNPYPPNGATNIPHGDVTLSWTCTDPDQGDTLTYNIYVSTTSPPLTLVAQNNPTTSFVINVPSGSRYWRIVSKDNHGDSTQGFIWTFRVQ
jgi:hypothetical protein